MLGFQLPWLRASLGTLVVLLLASGTAWTQGGGGGGHGGGGGGHGGVGAPVGGFGHASGFGFGVTSGGHHGGISGSGFAHGLGYNPSFGHGLYNSGFAQGLGYNPAFGRGYPYGYGYGQGLGYNYGLGYGFGLGYSLNSYYGQLGGYSGRSGVGYGLNYPFYGSGRVSNLPYLGYSSGWGGSFPYSYYGYNSSPYYEYSSAYGVSPMDYGMTAAQSQIPPPPKDDMAHILVVVPENAELWFNGTQTKQSGPMREFISPKLTVGKRYAYDIKARWQENGKTVEQTRTAHVQANNWQAIDFTKPESSANVKK